MTITDRPARTLQPTTTVIDGEVVYAHADLVPPTNPYRFSTRMTAALVLIAAGGALANVDSGPSANAINVAVLSVTVLLWLTCMFRFNARAEAGDR